MVVDNLLESSKNVVSLKFSGQSPLPAKFLLFVHLAKKWTLLGMRVLSTSETNKDKESTHFLIRD